MSRNVPREWWSYAYIYSEKILVGLRAIEQKFPLRSLGYAASSLRTRELRKFNEGRQAALFCYGMGKVIGASVSFALAESQDYDVIAKYTIREQSHFVPVQLKEWVPDTVNPAATLQQGIDKLRKYVDSEGLVIAFHLNRTARVEFHSLDFSNQAVKEIWFYGAAEPTQKKVVADRKSTFKPAVII